MMRIFFLALLPLLLLAGTGWGANSSRDFGGVGIDGVPRADGSIVVRQLVLGGPAQLAGVLAGDVITRIDGKATLGSDFKEMVEHRLRGRAGTEVTLQVKRPGSAKPLTFRLVRRQLALVGTGKKVPPKGE
jgi:C-terminal processing protease CtpA/Prc